jgi:uncharacterized protein with HEPN domain
MLREGYDEVPMKKAAKERDKIMFEYKGKTDKLVRAT